MDLNFLDWSVIIIYLIGMILMSIFLARGQKNHKDYYLGGNSIGPWPIAISTMATQCSTNSILGAPAFVAFSVGGGLVWLQYELAVPLAMIVVMMFLLPFFRRLNIVSVYQYLEFRFGVETKLILSILFQFLRAFGTGVIVYGISIVLAEIMGISFTYAVLLLGGITIIYDSIGGMKGVIYSDVLQMIVLMGSILMMLFLAVSLNGGWEETFRIFSAERVKAIDLAHSGFNGNNFSFWPMLFGGVFLYASYYGCDQSQVQRALATKSVDDTNYSLFLNGLLRFPLVLTYCLLGVAIGAYAIKNPEFIDLLPMNEAGGVNYNMAVPVFVSQYFSHGLIGLVMVGLFAAAMSSLDSTINSLSATSMEDIARYFIKDMKPKTELYLSKLFTVFWGSVCVLFSFYVGGISDSIIISVNKIGSLANGPILGVFALGILTKRANSLGAIVGLILGFLFDTYLWIYHPQVSWLWWNVIGFFTTYSLGYCVSLLQTMKSKKDLSELTWNRSLDQSKEMGFKRNWNYYYLALVIYFFLMLAILLLF